MKNKWLGEKKQAHILLIRRFFGKSRRRAKYFVPWMTFLMCARTCNTCWIYSCLRSSRFCEIQIWKSSFHSVFTCWIFTKVPECLHSSSILSPSVTTSYAVKCYPVLLPLSYNLWCLTLPSVSSFSLTLSFCLHLVTYQRGNRAFNLAPLHCMLRLRHHARLSHIIKNAADQSRPCPQIAKKTRPDSASTLHVTVVLA